MSEALPTRRAQSFLDPAALQDLKNLRFAAKRIVEGSFAGRHRSKLRGSSVEFADYREYTPGDDLRRLDWKVFMRTRRPYVRTYDEETNMNCLLALDISASMAFGGTGVLKPGSIDRAAGLSKLDYCRFLAAGLAYLIVENRDEAGLALLGQGLSDYSAPRSTRSHLDELLNKLERAQVAPVTRLAAGLQTLFSLCRKRGVLVLISDFIDEHLDEFFQAIRLFRHRRFEIVLFHVVHPEELALPQGRAIRFYDPESLHEVEIDPQDVERDYLDGFNAHLQRVRNMALGSGCEYEMIDTRTPYPDAIRAYLRAREAAS